MEFYDPHKRLIVLIAILIGGMLVLFSVARKEIADIFDIVPPERQKLSFIAAVSPQTDFVESRITTVVPSPELTAHAYLVRLIDNSLPLMRQRAWKPVAPASLTKLLTAVVARESLPSTAWILFSEHAKAVEPKVSPVEIGEFMLRDDMVRLALIASYNDATRALADGVEKQLQGYLSEISFSFFSGLMNQKANEVGANNSFFKNPSGLDGDEHIASAEDLARLAEYIWYNHPRIWEITRTIETVVYSDRGREVRIENTNDLLKEFPAILGGKTGFTDNAGDTLLFLYPVRPNHVAIVVILGSEDRFEDGRRIIRWLETINQ